MNGTNDRTIIRRRSIKFTHRVVAFISFWLALVSAPTRQAEFPLFANLLNSKTCPESIPSHNSEIRFPQILPERELRLIAIPARAPTDAEAWESFNAEYCPPRSSPSPIKREIETAKYGLDTMVFAVDHFAKTIENHLDFSFEQDGLRPTKAVSSEDSHNNPRVKLDLNVGEDNKPCYAGVRMIIPFGN